MKYRVIRQHFGDRMYMPGDEREAGEADVQHLVASGVLEPAGEKSEQAPHNKAEPAPKNKRRSRGKAKGD
jgi:hypothetical protein